MKPQRDETWQHFKGATYRIVAVGRHSEDWQEMVVYENVDPSKPGVWIRPLEMWNEKAVVKPTAEGQHNCMHPVQDRFTKDEQLWCQGCIDGAEIGRFVRIEGTP